MFEMLAMQKAFEREWKRRQAISEMKALQAELCGVGIAIVGVWDGDRLLMVRDTDAELRNRAGFN
jgi:hypothetical protein